MLCCTLPQRSNNQFLLIMKKTLITLLALAGMAGAAITDGQISYKGWDSETDNAYNGSIVSSGGADGKGYLDGINTVENEGISLYTNDGYSAASNNFTLAFKVRNWTNVTPGTSTLVSIAPYDTDATWLQTSLRTDENGAITLVNTTNSEETKTTVLTLSSDTVDVKNLQGNEWVSIIIMGNEQGLTLNVNGVSGTVNYNLSNQNTVDFQLAATKFRRGTTSFAEFDDLAFWNRTLEEEEIAFLAAGNLANGNTKLAPEPTTATLSLLALCGLAARRRRK